METVVVYACASCRGWGCNSCNQLGVATLEFWNMAIHALSFCGGSYDLEEMAQEDTGNGPQWTGTGQYIALERPKNYDHRTIQSARIEFAATKKHRAYGALLPYGL